MYTYNVFVGVLISTLSLLSTCSRIPFIRDKSEMLKLKRDNYSEVLYDI